MFFEHPLFIFLAERELSHKAIQIHESFHVFECHLLVLDVVHIAASFNPSFNDEDALLS